MNIPGFLLAKLYVKGTLRNTPDGFAFDLKNIIDSTSLTAVGPITVDGTAHEAADIALTIKDARSAASELSAAATLSLPVGVPLTVGVRSAPLAPGKHAITVVAVSADIGRLAFDITDTVK